MFTGLIEEVGRLKIISNNEISIYCGKILEDIKTGDSVSVNGTCLTVTGVYSNFIKFHVSPTTVKYTRFKSGDIYINELVNLERALTLNTRLGGHVVTGHIDGKAEIISIRKLQNDYYFEFLYPKKLKTLIVEKGSIAIDGISLTISEVLSASFVVTVIKHTFNSTNLVQKKVGDAVHIEVDLFARYINNILVKGGFDGIDSRFIEKFCKR